MLNFKTLPGLNDKILCAGPPWLLAIQLFYSMQ